MATLVRGTPVDEREELERIENWYRRELHRPVELPTYRFEPVRIGPTWQTETVNGVKRWILPERSLGWEALTFCGRWLQVTRGVPWQFTLEQARWMLWWYSLETDGSWTYRDAVFQRLKGHGKDPLGATLCMNEMIGNCRLDDWRGTRPIGRPFEEAWIQTAAVSLEQTKNTMRLLPGMVTPECKAHFGVAVQKEQVHALGDTRFMQAVTSSPTTLEGARASLVLMNEALALDTPLPTPDGWTTMGAVGVGDRLVGADGAPALVTYVTPPQVDRACYRVAFADGTSITASDGHLWLTKLSGSAAKPKVRTTAEMLSDGRRLRVPRAGALLSPDVALPIDPYVLGLWLGDGGADRPIVSAADADIGEAESLVRTRGFTTKRLKDQPKKAPRFLVSVADARRNRNDFRTTLSLHGLLSREGLFHNKHVPEKYLRAGYQQRLDLLRGLMDSDGCATELGFCVFVNSNEKISDAVMELLRSLGQSPRHAWTKDDRSRQGGYHRIGFTPRDLVPFNLTRKVARVGPAKANSGWLSITSIVPVESVPVKCVEVDSVDHLFLAGEGWTVTHNTHHWLANNSGHDMADVIERNATKSPGGSARTVRITNAFEAGLDSVAERDRDAYEASLDKDSRSGGSIGLLYDSLEAGPDAPLTAEDAPEIVNTIRGDSTWLDIKSIVSSIMDSRNPASRSRRFWYNQIDSAADSWMTRNSWDAIAAPNKMVQPREQIAAFFDGSKNDDTTGLVGCRISDGHVFKIGSWSRPPGGKAPNGGPWIVDRDEVDVTVRAMFEDYDVVAMYADPSDVRDTEGERFWEPMLDGWHRDFGPHLKHWAIKSGDRTHSIAWDMRSRERTSLFTDAAQRFVTEVQDKTFTHDGSRSMRQHVLNAKRRPNEYGISLGKEHRESLRKVDLAVCAVGARMVRRMYLNRSTDTKKPRSGKVW